MLIILYCTFKYFAHVLDRAVLVKDAYRGYLNFFRQEKELNFFHTWQLFFSTLPVANKGQISCGV